MLSVIMSIICTGESVKINIYILKYNNKIMIIIIIPSSLFWHMVYFGQNGVCYFFKNDLSYLISRLDGVRLFSKVINQNF